MNEKGIVGKKQNSNEGNPPVTDVDKVAGTLKNLNLNKENPIQIALAGRKVPIKIIKRNFTDISPITGLDFISVGSKRERALGDISNYSNEDDSIPLFTNRESPNSLKPDDIKRKSMNTSPSGIMNMH